MAPQAKLGTNDHALGKKPTRIRPMRRRLRMPHRRLATAATCTSGCALAAV
jgi:hypothetical protein